MKPLHLFLALTAALAMQTAQAVSPKQTVGAYTGGDCQNGAARVFINPKTPTGFFRLEH